MTRSLFAATAATGLTALTCLLATPSGAAELTVEIRGIRSDAGRVYVSVHTPREGEKFPYENGMFAGMHQQAHEGAMRFVFRDLPGGPYALSAFHDENANGSLDANVLGIPKEGYGFANDPPTTFGPPSFDAAAVTVGEAPVTAAVTMTY